MRALIFGAVLGMLLVLFGLPLVPLAAALPAMVQPVTVAFAAGLAARPYLPRIRRWAR